MQGSGAKQARTGHAWALGLGLTLTGFSTGFGPKPVPVDVSGFFSSGLSATDTSYDNMILFPILSPIPIHTRQKCVSGD
jgi:hypothetical protein